MSGINIGSSLSDTFDSAIWGSKTIGTSAVEINVSGTNLDKRQMVRIFNDSGTTIYFGYSNSVTVSGTYKGEPLFNNQDINIMLTQNQSLWAIASTTGNIVIVSEFA